MSTDNSTIVIASAARTPVGTFNGKLAGLPAHELGKVAIQAAMERARIEPGEVSERRHEPGAPSVARSRASGRQPRVGH